MSSAASDRNLLFGVLALQMDFLDRDALIAALHAWVLDKNRTLGQILVDQRVLNPDERDALDVLVQKHLGRHRGDVEKSLAHVAVPTPLRDELCSLADADVQASIAHLPTPSRQDEPGPLSVTVDEVKKIAGLRYQVLRPHDKGGIGEVFVALDQELNRQVALKEMQERHAGDAHTCGRFVREAEITGGLEHPGIVPVYGLGQYADGRPFYAMRFIQGETLKDAIAKFHAGDPGVTLRGLLTRFVAVCNAIAYAHSRGVIHRDLKPSNIMLGKYGETLVVDWGMAKAGIHELARSASDSLPEPTLTPLLADGIETQAGSAMGTPAYMSPEQATGRLDLLGPASDIYSLGATLYTLLTGRPPIEGKDTAEILRKAQRGDWLPPRQVKPDVPPALDAVCRKAMALAASERYATALALAADVERWLADEPVAAYREPWAVRSRRWMRRHRTLVSTAAGVLLIALLSATVGLVIIGEAWDNEAAARKSAVKEKEEAQKQNEKAQFNQYVAQMNLVQREYEANNIVRVRELLEAQVPREAGATDWRNFEWYYWQRMAQGEHLPLKGHMRSFSQVFFSPDGRRLALANRDQTVRVWDTATGQELLTLKGHTDEVDCMAFSPDGRRLATASLDNTVRVWETATGKELLKERMKTPESMVFNPDGRRLASAGDKTVRVWDTATGQELLTLKGHTDEVYRVAFSPDGRRLATASRDNTVRVWQTATGKELLALKGHTLWAQSVCFSPDGRRLASGGGDHTVRVWDAATGQELLTLKGHTYGVDCVAFSPDGRRLASGGGDGMIRVWDAAIGQELLTLKGHTGVVRSVCFSPDGLELLSTSVDEIRVWDIVTGQGPLTLKGHTNFVHSVCFSPDGRRLASASGDGTVRVWNAATGQELLNLKGHTSVGNMSGVRSVCFSPNGRRLVLVGFDRMVRVWDAASGRELLTLKEQKGGISTAAFSLDGQRLASGSEDGMIRVWDAATGQELLALKGHTNQVSGVCFSPDGHRLTSASGDGTVRVWDAATGQELLTLKRHTGGISSVAFSPDSRRLASATWDKTVHVWDAATGQELLTLKGHTDVVRNVCFSPDGRRLASASGDGAVRIWDAATGQELLTLKGHTDEVYCVAFSPDGRQLASGGGDPTVRVWEAFAVPGVVRRRRALVSQVDSLFEELGLRLEVLATLRKNPTLREADREFAVQVAQTHPENAGQLNEAAWKMVRSRDAGKDAYALALRQAEAAVRLAPRNGGFLNTLGVAQYRAGRYADALTTLTKSEKLNATKEGAIPDDLAFLAMTQQQLGKKDEAKATLVRLREVMKQPRWAQKAEAVGFLREAEELIEGKAADKKP